MDRPKRANFEILQGSKDNWYEQYAKALEDYCSFIESVHSVVLKEFEFYKNDNSRLNTRVCELLMKNNELEAEIKRVNELRDGIARFNKRIIKMDYKHLEENIKLLEAFDKACDVLASRGVPYEEKVKGGYCVGVTYKSKEDWKEYFLKNNEDEEGAEWLL